MQKFLLIIFMLSLTSAVRSQDTLNKPQAKEEKKYFELSLGHTLLFISNNQLEEIRANEAVIVPTNALLFFSEFRPLKRCRIPVFLNLPTQSKQFLVNGQLISERASPTFGTGVIFRIFQFPIGSKSHVEMEAGPLASFLHNQNNVIRFAPVGASRFRFIKNKDFVIYMGCSYSAGINVFGVLFGTGYIF